MMAHGCSSKLWASPAHPKIHPILLRNHKNNPKKWLIQNPGELPCTFFVSTDKLHFLVQFYARDSCYMLWQFSSQKQLHILQTSETLRCSHAPEDFQPGGDARGRSESEIGPSVSKTSRFLRALSLPRPAHLDSGRNPAGATLGATGEELQLLPSGEGSCLTWAVLTGPVPARHVGCLQVKGIRDSGISHHEPTCISTEEPGAPGCASLVPPPASDVG